MQGDGGPGMLNSMEMMREEYLHEMPKSITIHTGSAAKGEQVPHDFSFKGKN